MILSIWVLFFLNVARGGVHFYRSRVKGDPAVGVNYDHDQYNLPTVINNDNKVNFTLYLSGYPNDTFSVCFHDDDWLRWGEHAAIWAGDEYGVNNCRICFKTNPNCTTSKFSINAKATIKDVQAGSRIKGEFSIVIPQFKWNIDCPACGGRCIIKIPILEKIYNISMPDCPLDIDFGGIGSIIPGAKWLPLDPLPDDFGAALVGSGTNTDVIKGPVRLINPDGSLSFEMHLQFKIRGVTRPPEQGVDPNIGVNASTTSFPPINVLQTVLGGGNDDTDDNEGLPNLLSLFEVNMGARRNLGEEQASVMPQFELLAAATDWIGHGMDQLMAVGSTIRRHLEEVGQL